MAFKLTKQELNRRDVLRDKIIEARLALDEVIGEQSGKIEDSYAVINQALENYNEVTQEAYGFFEDIHAEREGDYDDKSERWQESDRGQAAYEWLEEVAGLRDDMDTIQPLSFGGIEIEIPDHAEAIENLTEEAGC